MALVLDTLALLTRYHPPAKVKLVSLTDKIRRMSPWRRLRDNPSLGLDSWTYGELDQLARREADSVAALDDRDAFAHTDVHELNLLIRDRRAWLVDWAWVRTGPSWADLAYLVIRLIQAGHQPRRQNAARRTGGGHGFAAEVHGMWEYLRHVTEVDQQVRLPCIRGVHPTQAERERLVEVDEDNTAWLETVVNQLGWPGYRLVGQLGAQYAWLLAQHADRRPELQRHWLMLLEGAVEAGDASPDHLAYLRDRVATADRRPQRYGTQWRGYHLAPSKTRNA